VIFDMVDGVGRGEVGRLLRDDTGIRLVNVAITRARGKLIVIADKTWYARSCLDRNNSLLEHLISGKTNVKQIQVVSPPAPHGNGQAGDDGTESPIEKLLLDAMRKHPNCLPCRRSTPFVTRTIVWCRERTLRSLRSSTPSIAMAGSGISSRTDGSVTYANAMP
jgi:hypothetical protein